MNCLLAPADKLYHACVCAQQTHTKNSVKIVPAISLPFAPLPTLAMVLFYSHASICCVGYVLTSENLELGASNERKHVTFVFLGLSYLIQYDMSQFNAFTCNFHGFFFPYS